MILSIVRNNHNCTMLRGSIGWVDVVGMKGSWQVRGKGGFCRLHEIFHTVCWTFCLEHCRCLPDHKGLVENFGRSDILKLK